MSVKKNTLWNLFGTASPMLIGVASVPYMYEQIGTERLGVLTVIWAIIGYFSIFDFGLGRALTQRIAALPSAENTDTIGKIAKSGLLLTFFIGLIGCVLGLVAVTTLGVNWMNANLGLRDEIFQSFILASIAIPMVTTTTGLRGVLEGINQFRTTNILRFFLGISNFVGPIISIVFYGPNLAYIVATIVLARLLILAAHFGVTRNKISLNHSGWCKKTSQELLHFGSWMTLSNLISPLMVVADRFFISSKLGALIVAYYTIPSEFLIRLLILPAALTTSLFPVFSKVISSQGGKTDKVYKKSLITILTVMFPITALIFFCSRWGLGLWLDAQFAEKAYAITSILAIGILFNSLAQVPHAFIQASGDAKTTAIIHLIEVVLYIPGLLVALQFYGLEGAAASWTLRALADLCLLHIFAQKIRLK